MRNDLFNLIHSELGRNKKSLFITSDLGFPYVSKLAKRYGRRIINVGVSEQLMIGIATGLAKKNFTPICYSIVNFSVYRTFEFIRNGPVFHNLPVKIVGMGAGLDYAFDGFTHNSLEDLNIVRSLPGIKIFSPTNKMSLQKYFNKMIKSNGPCYLRLQRTYKNFPDNSTKMDDTKILILNIGANRYRIENIINRTNKEFDILSIENLSLRSIENLAERFKKRKKIIIVIDNYENNNIANHLSKVIKNNNSNVTITIDGMVEKIVHTGSDFESLDTLYRRNLNSIKI